MQKRYWIILIITILIAVWGAGKYVAYQQIKSLIADANKNGNELAVESFSVRMRLLTLGLTVEEVKLKQLVGNQLISGKIEHLEMSGLRLISLLLKQTPTVTSLILDGPSLVIRDSIVALKDSSDQQSKDRPLLKINEVEINGGSVEKQDKNRDKVAMVKGLQLRVADFMIPPTPQFINTVDLSIDSITAPNKESASDWLITGIKHVPNTSVFSIGQLKKQPRSTAQNYLSSIPYKQEWLAIRLDSISIGNFPLDALMKGDSATIELLEVQDFSLAIYENPALSRNPSEPRKPMPVENFRKLGLPLIIKELNVKRCQIEYGAVGEPSKKAQLRLEDGSINLSNFSTTPSSDSARIVANFNFNGAAPLTVNFALDQSGKGRNFRTWGEMDSYSLVDLNPLMVIAANVLLKSGQLNKLTFHAEIKEDVSQGKMLFTYNDLDIKIEGGNAWIKNLAKGFVVQDRNPRNNGKLRMGSIYHEHPGDRSFFNLFWKSIVSGMQSTVAANLVNSKEMDSEVVE